MDVRIIRFTIEFYFVIICLYILKTWVFPFLISIWFPVSELSEMLSEWTLLMVGVISVFIYLGLGSAAKWSYGLSWKESSILFFLYHLPLFLIPVPQVRMIAEDWTQLLGELFILFGWDFGGYEALIMVLMFFVFLVGRIIRLRDREDLISGIEMKNKKGVFRQNIR